MNTYNIYISNFLLSRYTRGDRFHNQSLHYFNSFPVRDRIPLQQLSQFETHVCPTLSSITELILPSKQDDEALIKDLTKIVSRILVDNMPFFQILFGNVVDRHIPHKYSREMSHKSIIVRQYIHWVKMTFEFHHL